MLLPYKMDVEATEVGKRPHVGSKQSCHGMEHYVYLECIMLLNYLIFVNLLY